MQVWEGKEANYLIIDYTGWDKTKASDKKRKLIENAETGIKNLMRTKNITLSKMESGDWTFFFDELVEDEIQQRKERQSLDNEIGDFLKICQNGVKDETKQRDMESATEGMKQLDLSGSQNKKK